MKTFLYFLGIICTAGGAVVAAVAFKASRVAEQVIRSLETEDALFEASNTPSISVWYNRSDNIHIAWVTGLVLIISGLLIILLNTFLRNRKKTV